MILEIGKVIADRYEIVEQIGTGGMSYVYRAVDKKLHRNVTFKVLREEYVSDAKFVNRFDIEARAIASLNHANIVNVYDVGTEGDINYIVMEYIHGKTLKQLILEKAPFSNETMLGVASQIAAALIHAHENGIIHRDIKPQNILCMSNGVVKVADFGIARSHNARRENDEFSTMGSVHYISPEVACSDPIDPRSDLYSLGIVMYEMMTGELPFDSDSADEIAMAHVEAPFPNARKKNPEILPIVREIIVRLTNKQPFRRYQSANSLYNDIQRAIMECTSEGEHFAEDFAQSHYGEPDYIADERPTPRPRPVNRSYAQKSPRDKQKERIIILGGVATAAVLIFGLAMLISFLIGSNGDDDLLGIQLPNLAGMAFADALDEMEELGLELEEAGREAHQDIPEGYIIEMEDFEPGERVAEGTTVMVLVSSGPEGRDRVAVPSIVGLSLADAIYALDDLPIDLNRNYTQEYSDTVEHRHIISQYPDAGMMVDHNTEVTVVLSRGPSLVAMPNLIDLDFIAARSAIALAGLTPGNETLVDRPDRPQGTVVAQGFPEGQMLMRGTQVSFSIAQGGAHPSQVPDEPDDEPDTDQPDDDDEPDVPEPPEPDDNDDEPQPPEPDTDTGQEPATISRVLSLTPPGVPAGESVPFELRRRQPDGTLAHVHSQNVSAANLPIDIIVQGTGVVEFVMFVDGQLVGEEWVVFGH